VFGVTRKRIPDKKQDDVISNHAARLQTVLGLLRPLLECSFKCLKNNLKQSYSMFFMKILSSVSYFRKYKFLITIILLQLISSTTVVNLLQIVGMEVI